MKAKLRFVLSISILFGCFYGAAQQEYWQKIPLQAAKTTTKIAEDDLVYGLNTLQFQKVLKQVASQKKSSILFPDAKKGIVTYSFWETPVLHPDLAKKYPQIQSFTGVSADGTSKIHFSHSPEGLKAMIVHIDQGKTVFIEPIKNEIDTYRLYSKGKLKSAFECTTPKAFGSMLFSKTQKLVDDQILRRYRIAVSTTGEYTTYHGGTVAGALAAINATLTRVNAVFETDLGVRLELVANNDEVIFTDATTDPYTGSFNAQVQNTLTNVIGEANYDVGHLFHRDNDNGNAGFIGSVCVDNRKGSAFASGLNPEGDLFDLDFVAHELGHQFGANHTWSFESEGTGVQAEPASGTTIMGYAGIVEGNNVAPNGDDYFHHLSIVQIQEYLATTACSVNVDLTNAPPVIAPQPDHIIPRGTAFSLTADATDTDGDMLTYTWEQIDNGVVVTSTFGSENISGANFRSLPPSVETTRYFPRLPQILNGNLEQTNPIINDAWETVSNVQRELNFALTVRDNNAEGGQVASDSVKIDVISTAGPFQVTSQNTATTYVAGSVQTITWDVANTNRPPINVETVNIFLSTDGGVTFPVLLAEEQPNTGSAQIQLPGLATTRARIMIRANNNVFLAVNSAEFTIEQTQAILNFDELTYGVCKPNDITIPFTYEAFGGFSETMVLSINSSEAFSASFSQPDVLNNNTAVDLTLGNITNIPVGTHSVEVIATGPTFSASTTIEVTVLEDNFNAVVLSFPEDMAAAADINPEFVWMEDPNADAYEIQIASDETFATFIESSIVSFTSYKSTLLLPETQYYWRVRPRNQCGEGNFGPAFSFTTSVVNCQVFDSGNTPQDISAEGTPTITASIFLAEDLKIADVNVNLEISHTFLEDLTVNLISPMGTRVPLISKNCGNNNNLIAIFDDDGATLTCSGNPAISGVVQPLGSLSAFNGESTLGEWVLEIQDTAVSDGGALNAFSLEICVEGSFRPDDDEDGVFDDGDDLCLGTPKGTLVDTSGCPINAFPANNFSVAIQSEACRDTNDGSVSITALDTSIDYTAILSGNAVEIMNPFNDLTTFSNLAAGTYQLCITGMDTAITFRETCFDVVIDQPEPLSVLSNLSADGTRLQLQLSGGQLYNIELNGEVEQTLETEFSIDLPPGRNVIKVSSGVLCQGIFEEQFFVIDVPQVIPNPTTGLAMVQSIFNEQEVQVAIYTAEGRFIRTNNTTPKGHMFEINVSDLSNGLYFLVMESEGISQSSKLIKR